MTLPNLDPQEIRTFEAAAGSWWDPEGEFKTLHQMNPLRLSVITQLVDLAGKKVIDVGCGGGILSESMAKCGAEVTGIDLAGSVLSVAQTHAQENNLSINYQQISTEDMAEACPHTFDVLTCMELLEHVPDPTAIVKACAALVKPGGHLFFSTVNRNLKSYLSVIIGAEYLLKLLPKGVHHYEKFIRPSELALWGRQAGLELVGMSGVSYNPFTQQFKLSKKIDVNYLLSFSLPGS